MNLQPITNYHRWIQGTAPLPAGAVPLAGRASAGLVCLMPTGRWILWLGGVARSMPPQTQREAMEVLIAQMGGTAATMATALDVSPRTVEAWRHGKSPLPIRVAYRIANEIAGTTGDNLQDSKPATPSAQ